MRRSAPARLTALAVGALLGGLGCELILNVDGIRIYKYPPQPELMDAAATAPPADCEEGQLRCEGVALQLCSPESGAFRTVRVCSTPELCCDGADCGASQGCLAPACARGDFRCDGATLSICNDAQTGWTSLDSCVTAAHCNASLGRCTDAPCDPSGQDYQCNGAALEQCQATGWRVVDNCSTAGLCSAESAAPGCAPTACTIDGNQPVPFQCSYGDLTRCNDAQTGFETVETCLSATRCAPLIEDLAGDPHAPGLSTEVLSALGCQPANCTPGRFRCERDGSLVRCNANLTGYLDHVDSCQSAAHCNAASGACEPLPCSVGKTQCSGADYQRCTGAGWQHVQTCSSAAQCDHQQGCTPPVCQATEYRCDGPELMRCNVSLSGWIPVRTCDSEALCNAAAKRCDAPLCVEGQRRCSRDGQLQRCSVELDSWLGVEDCQAALGAAVANASAACDPTGTGRCLAEASCAPGTLRCNGQFLERCRDEAWVPHARCASAALCDAAGTGSCLPPSCQPGTYRCVESEANPVAAGPGEPSRGLLLQRCNASGTGFERHELCSAERFCDAAHGQCDICDARQPAFCVGNELSLCTADGQERTLQRICSGGCTTPEPLGPPACRSADPSAPLAAPGPGF